MEKKQLGVKLSKKAIKKIAMANSKRPRSKSNWRKKAVEVAKEIAKNRDNYTCLWCGRSKKQGYQIHGSHIFGTGAHPKLAAEVLNIKALCARCHFKWHSTPLEGSKWFSSKFPIWLQKVDKLRKEKEANIKKVNWEKETEELNKIKWKEMGL